MTGCAALYPDTPYRTPYPYTPHPFPLYYPYTPTYLPITQQKYLYTPITLTTEQRLRRHLDDWLHLPTPLSYTPCHNTPIPIITPYPLPLTHITIPEQRRHFHDWLRLPCSRARMRVSPRRFQL